MSFLQQPQKTAVLYLLHAANLPTEDITDGHLHNFWGYVADGKVIGVVGLEPFTDRGLLRSLTVDPAHRGCGLGKQLVHHAEQMALRMAMRELFLLTDSAQEFFETLGYARTNRQNAPVEIRSSREFAELCPSSSLLMKKSLR
jgi:amino-acid N-acetyltransferase